jgi:hypothetical protein
MTTITITGTITDTDGATASFSCSAQADTITGSGVVTPQTAPAGTTRNLTATGVSSAGLVLTYNTPVATGITFTPVSGQPNQWTFVY